MLNNIAVVLIGEFRTGEIVSKYTKQFFETISKSADYYIVSYTNQNVDSIKECYPNSSVKLIDSTRINNVYFSRAYLSKLGLELIGNKLENYDQIVETRPDLFLKSKITESVIFCNQQEFTGAGYQKIISINGEDSAETLDPKTLDKTKLPKTLLIGESYFRMHPIGYQCYAKRIDFDYGFPNKFIYPSRYINNIHGMTAEFLIKNDFVNVGTDYQFETVIRNPDMINYDLDSMTFEEIQKLNDKNRLK